MRVRKGLIWENGGNIFIISLQDICISPGVIHLENHIENHFENHFDIIILITLHATQFDAIQK